MRIALVANEYPPEPHGGIGTFTQVYARALAGAGHEVSVIGIAPTGSTREDSGVEVVRLRQSSIRGVAGVLNRRRVSRWLEARDFDMVECPEFQGMLPYGLGRCPVVIRLHLSATTIARRAGVRESVAVRWAERRTLQRTRNWIGVSQYARDLTIECFGIAPERTQIIRYPIAPSRRASAPSASPPVVLFAGRVSERKGALRLARAAVRFLRDVPEARLVYVGDEEVVSGEPIRALISRTIGPERMSRVEFMGRLAPDALRELMGRSSVFAFPSSLETFGLVVAEAMAEGRAVVVPDTSPFTEFVADGVTGRRVPLEDEGLWGATIAELLRNGPAADEMGVRARRHIEREFSIERCVSASLDFYREVIRARRLGAHAQSEGAA